ncbi:hypothetical protein CONCODRAFT_13035 [Conidiobolus coronatus NRRL 28638]|uniref:CsbD-like domain-containing protein n=1 Tax=Conidiobolus coronatus (strain ATCC 28846 / CBS 209.66 / NRRL 28638) TaxID=796925 RepID=A0A137NRR4_CONC2|nr:hypothetical protein CONCODRAFT_13035 [Conidiobolus coronatus NRRL 28638]|eukprot:KXN65380.1 hypothetical protein CONCODRAFT_13035 [Conidiobolus coronatus NRRL 28638]
MSYDPSKTNANYNKGMGSVKEGLGSALGNKEMQAKGNVQNQQGHGEQKAAETKGWVQGAMDTVTGTVKDMAGSVTGNTGKQAEGKAQKAQGDYRKGINA